VTYPLGPSIPAGVCRPGFESQHKVTALLSNNHNFTITFPAQNGLTLKKVAFSCKKCQ